jgi:hypothetical protein
VIQRQIEAEAVQSGDGAARRPRFTDLSHLLRLAGPWITRPYLVGRLTALSALRYGWLKSNRPL